MSVLECIWFASALFVWLCVSRLQHKCHSCAASLVFELRSIVSHPLPHDRQLLLRQSMADRRKNKRPVIASIVALSLFGVQDCIERGQWWVYFQNPTWAKAWTVLAMVGNLLWFAPLTLFRWMFTCSYVQQYVKYVAWNAHIRRLANLCVPQQKLFTLWSWSDSANIGGNGTRPRFAWKLMSLRQEGREGVSKLPHVCFTLYLCNAWNTSEIVKAGAASRRQGKNREPHWSRSGLADGGWLHFATSHTCGSGT